MTLRVVFMGTPAFALPTIEALAAAGFDIPAVYSQPPRPGGRGQRPRPGPVHAWAEARDIPVRTPTSLREAAEQAAFAALNADAAVVVAYGLILPPAVLAAPRLGCLNLHASRLPRWRGAAPIQRAVMAGDQETAATVMLMDEGLDTGPVLLERGVAIGPATTSGDLHDELADLGGPLMVEALRGLAAGSLMPRPQPAAGACYAGKIDKAEARIDWSRPAAVVAGQINGLSPVPGAWFPLAGARVKVLRAEPAAGAGAAGTVLDQQPAIACGEGAVRLLELQRAGKAPLPADGFLRGTPLPPGSVLD